MGGENVDMYAATRINARWRGKGFLAGLARPQPSTPQTSPSADHQSPLRPHANLPILNPRLPLHRLCTFVVQDYVMMYWSLYSSSVLQTARASSSTY